MAEDETKTTDDAAADGEDKPSGGMMGKVKVAVFILAITAVECVLAYMYVGSADPQATARAAADELAENPEDGIGDEPTTEETIEVTMGDFDITSFQPPNTTLRISFKLYGVVATDDEAELTALFEEKQQRFRQDVLEIIRSSEVTDFTDPVLGLIKRKILEKINRITGAIKVRVMLITDFSYYEQ